MKLYCILGDERVFHSKSPVMHNTVMKQVGWNGLYVAFAVAPDRVRDAMQGIRALGIAGANVTIPHKEALIPHLDELSETASTLGAINTIVNREDLLCGYNTDVEGFMKALQRAEFPLKGKSVLVFGAGGAAKAILLGLRRLGTERLFLANRSKRRAEDVARLFRAEALPLDSLQEITAQVDLVINATAVSSFHEGPQLAHLVSNLPLPRCSLIIDINYGRKANIWEDLAKAHGIPFMDGIPMLAHQAARSFALWTGLDVGGERFLEVLKGSA